LISSFSLFLTLVLCTLSKRGEWRGRRTQKGERGEEGHPPLGSLASLLLFSPSFSLFLSKLFSLFFLCLFSRAPLSLFVKKKKEKKIETFFVFGKLFKRFFLSLSLLVLLLNACYAQNRR
jgi:hypothetical protein